jgi:hypothetical protein
MKNHLVFYSSKNHWPKKDGNEFRREARAYAAYWQAKGDTVYLRDFGAGPRSKRRLIITRELIDHLRSQKSTIKTNIDVIAFFCHGYAKGFQGGFLGEDEVRQAAQLCLLNSPKSVVFYACSMGKHEKASLAWFAEEIGMAARVFGHRTAGHTTRNPHVIEHHGQRRIHYRKELKKIGDWKKWVMDMKTDYRYELPFNDWLSGISEDKTDDVPRG